MPVAAWAIPAAIGAGVSLWGTHKQASAAKDAAGQQVASAEQAKRELAPIYQANVARLDPYASLGANAVGSLGSLMGFPSGGGGTAMAPAAMTPQQQAVAGNDPTTPASARETLQNTTGTFAVPRATLRTASSYGSGNTLGSLGGAMRGRMVRLQAPTGEVGEFPAEEAAFYLQQGASRLS